MPDDRPKSQHPDHRVLSMFLAAGLVIVAVVFLAVSLGAGEDAAVSAYTQAHGVRENAVVDSDSMTCADYDLYHSCSQRANLYAQLDVTLRRPVGGQATSSVDLNQDPRLPKGDVITVLVDPQNPSYAELPGKPFNTPADSEAGYVVSAALFVVAMGIVFVPLLRKRRQRQARQYAGQARS